MNEGKKTGIFWGAAIVMALVAAFVSWPTTPGEDGDGSGVPIDEPLFREFKDPLVAANLKIVTFDEEQGQLAQFEVRKDPESGNWTIPSRDGYPADAVEQMQNAANSLVDLKVLDKPTANAEDHAKMGVVEPKLEALKIGDEGVGRLVTFKDENQKVLASLILGDPVKERPGQIYVREPGQDLVYVVALDDSPLTTKFQEWIEEDLLKLSSIDIDQLNVKDYSASLGQGGGIAVKRKYEANFKKDGTQWSLSELREFDSPDPRSKGNVVKVEDDQKLDTSNLNDVQNALDELKIVNVIRKPDGMSANLRADKDFLADQDAINSLAQRGFYPVPLGEDGAIEILSANGELTVGLKDGVEYVLRFGNIASTSIQDEEQSEEGESKAAGGVNRYLLVTTRVDNDRFPAPELTPVPQTLEELEALNSPPQEDLPAEPEPAAEPKDEPTTESSESEEAAQDDKMPAEDADKEPTAGDDSKPEKKEPKETKPADKADSTPSEEPASTDGDKTDKAADKPEPKDSEPETSEPKTSDTETGETESEGSGEASGTGQAQDEKVSDEKKDDAGDDPDDTDTSDDKGSDAAANESKEPVAEPVKAEEKESTDAEPAMDSKEAVADAEVEEPAAEETEEEKQERLEAAQEKITKENQRLLDERKDKLEKATGRVRELNSRFADWYYVIPEDTYSKLTIKRDDLFQKPGEADANPGAARPPFNMGGGLPPGFPGN